MSRFPSEPAGAGEAPDNETALLEALAAERKKAETFYDQLLRLKAEFENFRKRADKEKREARDWGKQEALMPIISLVDVFDQALAHAKQAKDAASVLEGLEMLHRNFSQFLKVEGIESIQTVGETFDPEVAEAVEQVEVDEEQAGTVVAELQKGYRFQGRILRPGRVKVGVARSAPENPEAG